MRHHPNTIDFEGVGKRLSAARREELHLTQGAFAEKVGYNNKTIGKIENGAPCSIQFLYDVYVHTGISTDYLLYGTKPPKEYSISKNTTFHLHDSGGEFLRKVRDFYIPLQNDIKPLFERSVQTAIDTINHFGRHDKSI